MRHLKTSLFACALAMMFPSTSHALSSDCAGASAPNLVAQCASEESSEADADLGKLIRYMQARTTPLWQPKLSTLQQSWVVFRKQQCELEGAPYEGGASYTLVMARCYTRLARARIRDLSALDCVKGTALICGN